MSVSVILYNVIQNLINLFVGNPRAQEYTIQITKALAMTGIDILVNSSLLADIKKNFQDAKK